MERLEKLINILKLTPHYQPELVKEACNRILSRSIREDNQVRSRATELLRPLIEILIQYCDTEDSAQRSLFNDYLNTIVLYFQHSEYHIIFEVFLNQVTNNGSARTVTAALQRLPNLINNVQPIELGCEPQRLLKALIEVCRRSDDEIVLRALDTSLVQIVPYLDYHVTKSKDMQMLSNSLIELLVKNLNHQSMQTKRLAASSLATLSSSSTSLKKTILEKLSRIIDNLKNDDVQDCLSGFSQCVKLIPDLMKKHQDDIIKAILKQFEKETNDQLLLMSASLDLFRDIMRYPVSNELIQQVARVIIDKFLIQRDNNELVVKPDVKVILKVNALTCIADMISQNPSILDQNEYLISIPDDDVTINKIKNQIVIMIGNYIRASWDFPHCVDKRVDCERIRKLWVQLRAIMTSDGADEDTLKCCIIALKNCVPTLLESDHCLHIVEYKDIINLIQKYHKTNAKPLKVELLSLFASLNFRTLHYLERVHWSKMLSRIAGSLTETLQTKILRDIIMKSLTDEHKLVRQAGSSALVTIVTNLFISLPNSQPDDCLQRCPDTIVDLAQDLADEHLEVLRQAQESIHSAAEDQSSINYRPRINPNRLMSSSILQTSENRSKQSDSNSQDIAKTYHHNNICINLKYIVDHLKTELNEKFDQGKIAIASIVQTMHELSLAYPINRYTSSWDCRPSEYCGCFTTLNMLLTYMENLADPDVIVEDLNTYKDFLLLTGKLLYSVCHQCVLSAYENQRAKPLHKRQATTRDGDWSELIIKPAMVASCLEVYLTHLTKLLCLLSAILEEKPNPLSTSSKLNQSFQQQMPDTSDLHPEELMGAHATLVSNSQIYTKLFEKLESSYKSGKKNLNQSDERFYQILETCLNNLSQLLEFINMNDSLKRVKEGILGNLKITFRTCSVPSLECARQLLKSLFGINIISLYQVDPIDWFDDKLWFHTSQNSPKKQANADKNCQTVHHHLITNPYKIISKYYSVNCFNITPTLDNKGLTILDYESRRALIVRRRIEERVKSLFETNYLELSVKMRTISDTLKHTITEFTPIVKLCMSQFDTRGFCQFQTEVVHFMSYLVLLRVNFTKLENSQKLIKSIDKMLDDCGEKKFMSRVDNMKQYLRFSFTFLTLLTYERGPSKPMFQVAAVIQKLDDMRAKIRMQNSNEDDTTTNIMRIMFTNYIIPLLRCLVEDLFIYRTDYFQIETGKTEFDSQTQTLITPKTKNDSEQPKDQYQQLEAERETVAQRLLDVVDDPEVYDMLAILILESRWNSSEIKYKKLSQSLLSIIPSMLSRQEIKFNSYTSIELARHIIEHISPEIFQPVDFVCDIWDPAKNEKRCAKQFHRWMSKHVIAIHVLTTQVKEEIFLARLPESIKVDSFVDYVLLIAQICIAELIICINNNKINDEVCGSNDVLKPLLLVQQLSSYILYLTHMFQSGLFFQLTKTAVDQIKKSIERELRGRTPQLPTNFLKLCNWARNPRNKFSLLACERMFFDIRLIYPDLTILWCNLMMLLNNVDCNQKFWRNLLIYECHHCSGDKLTEQNQLDNLTSADHTDDVQSVIEESAEDNFTITSNSTTIKDETKFRRPNYINRPSSLNLSEINLENQLRRSFIKKIAEVDTKDKPLNRNIVEHSDDNGILLESQATMGNTEQCLSPNVELTRRGALCLVLDFVTITMNDVEHIVWLIIHQINDIIRWSHEPPISEYITAIHSNSASSGIFIQAINWSFTNLDSISVVRRLLWTLRDVHYTQYGSLVTLLVEKLLSSTELLPYISETRYIEEFACATVEKLRNETNRGLVTTNEEVFNQLGTEDLIRIYSKLDHQLYPKLSKMLLEYSGNTPDMLVGLTMNMDKDDSDDDCSDSDDMDLLFKKAHLIYKLAEKGETARITILIPALNSIRDHLADKSSLSKINQDQPLACMIISAVFALSFTIPLERPKRLIKPEIWSNDSGNREPESKTSKVSSPRPPLNPRSMQLSLDFTSSPRIRTPTPKLEPKITFSRDKKYSDEELRELVRDACLKGSYLLDNISSLRDTQYKCLYEVIIRLARMPMINSFVLIPPQIWKQKQNVWPTQSDFKHDQSNSYKTNFPMVSHDILLKDLSQGYIEKFCERLLLIGWINKRQFEEAWNALILALSATMSHSIRNHDESEIIDQQEEKLKLKASCTLITSITLFLLLSNRQEVGNPLTDDIYPSQTFESRVIDITRSISSNLSELRKKTKGIFEFLDLERKMNLSNNIYLNSKNNQNDVDSVKFNRYLRVPAVKLRYNATEMQDFVVIEKENDSKYDQPDIGSCIKFLLSSVYQQKLGKPNESLIEPTSSDLDESTTSSTLGMDFMLSSPLHQSQQIITPKRLSSISSKNISRASNQIPPPIASAICQSILAVSDLFTELDQFDWMFETFINMFKTAESNDDEIQSQYLIVGICKSVAICCYEIPGEQVTISTSHHRDFMFEKCLKCIKECMQSKFGPLRTNTLSGAFYMLEDSVHIVASGAYELEHFKKLRQSRLDWIPQLSPYLLKDDNLLFLTKRPQIIKLLEYLCRHVQEASKKS